MAPQTRGSGSFILVVLEKECLQEVICEASGMRETIDAITDFEIHPALVYVFLEVILANEILRDIGELDFYVFGIVKWRREVVVADVVGDELGFFAGEYTVDHKFAKI